MWDLLKLKQQIVADESCAHITGESVSTKQVGSTELQALAAWTGAFKGRKDPNNPVWLAKQMCYACGTIGHLWMNCTVSSALHEAHKAKHAAERAAAEPTAHAAAGPDLLAMVAELSMDDDPVVCAAQGDEPPLK